MGFVTTLSNDHERSIARWSQVASNKEFYSSEIFPTCRQQIIRSITSLQPSRYSYRRKYIVWIHLSFKNLVLYFGIILILSSALVTGQDIIGVLGPVVDEQACYKNLVEADRNNDEFMNKSEYINFINLQSNGYFENHIERTNGNFDELPPALICLFSKLACDLDVDLEDPSRSSCDSAACSRRIKIEGSYNPDDTVDADQSKLLYTTCRDSISVIKNLITPAPTLLPSSPPSTTPLPSTPPSIVTSKPTLKPTMSPTIPKSGYNGPLVFNYEVTMSHTGGYDANDILNNKDENGIRDDLINSIIDITSEIAGKWPDPLDLRRLALSYESKNVPGIAYIKDRECPGNPTPVDDASCVDVQFNTTVFVENEDEERVRNDFDTSFRNAITKNYLSEKAVAEEGYIVYVIAKAATPTNAKVPLGTSELAGIGAAGFILGFALIGAMFIHGRKRRSFLKENVELEGDDENFLRETDDRFDANSPTSVSSGLRSQAGDVQNIEHLSRRSSSSKKKKKRTSPLIGASHPHYGNNRPPSARSSILNLTDDNASSSESNFSESYASSSNAGSSGWSSGGVSSLNTASVESIENDRRMQGSSLVSIGLASGMTSRLSGNDQQGNVHFIPFSRRSTHGTDVDTISTNSDQIVSGTGGPDGGVPNLPVISRADLDDAIQAGDWAAVGATAALLANAASDTVSLSTKSYSTNKSSDASTVSNSLQSGVSSVDAARAAELDHLVDSGNWDGVVLAAAKFEAASERGSTDSENSQSFRNIGDKDSSFYTDKSSKASASGSFVSSAGQTSSSLYSTATGSVTSESLSRARKRDEIKSEVEALVRRVVPDEIDNVDEMMLQFKGREEELLETLRTMQERSIAQRARAAVHKSAKREAKLEARNRQSQQRLQSYKSASSIGYNTPNVITPTKQTSSASIGESSAFSDSQSHTTGTSKGGRSAFSSSSSRKMRKSNLSSRSSTSGSMSEGRKKKSALDMAIEAGDWEAVGEAAAMMSGNDENSSMSSGGLQRLASSRSIGSKSSATTGGGSRTTISGKSSLGADGKFSIGSSKADQLDDMIDRGDWQGVVAAASLFTTGESGPLNASGRVVPKVDSIRMKTPDTDSVKTPLSSKSSESTTLSLKSWGSRIFQKSASKRKTDSTEDDAQEKKKPTAEEQEALAQADLWMSIAESSKQDKKYEARGASDAADWAISRSLTALRHAERDASDDNSPSNSSKGDNSV